MEPTVTIPAPGADTPMIGANAALGHQAIDSNAGRAPDDTAPPAASPFPTQANAPARAPFSTPPPGLRAALRARFADKPFTGLAAAAVVGMVVGRLIG